MAGINLYLQCWHYNKTLRKCVAIKGAYCKIIRDKI